MLKAERGVRLCVGEYGRTSEASTTRAGAIGRKSWKSRRAVTKLPAEQTDGEKAVPWIQQVTYSRVLQVLLCLLLLAVCSLAYGTRQRSML